jgi:hypothetical protein
MATLGLAVLLSCSGKQPAAEGVPRLLITHTENLSGNPALDGVSRAISHLVRAQLSGSATLAVFEAADASEAGSRRAARIVRSWLELQGDHLKLHVNVRSADGKSLEQWESSALAAEGPSPLASAIVNKLAPAAPAAALLPAEAAALFGNALSQPPAAAIPLLERVVTQAPAWGDAYFLLGANLSAAGRAAEARNAWTAGIARSNNEIAKARMQAALATAEQNTAAAAEAAEKLATLLPSEPELSMQAGNLRLARGDFAKAAALMSIALKAEPGVGEWWNQIAFTQALAGNAQAARASIARYAQLEPASANPPDSLGEIEFLLGRFPESAKEFLAAHQRQPQFLSGATLFKAAQAHLMAGDAAAAEKEFALYLNGPLKGHPQAALYRLRWLYRTGKKTEAVQQAAALAAQGNTPPDLAAAALAQSALWQLTSGDRAKAFETARAAMQKAQSPVAKREALIAFYLAQPSAGVEEWKRRAGGKPTDDLLALALIFDRKWSDALPVLDRLLTNTHPFRAGHWRVLYAWALLETGARDKAAPWLRWYPIPLSSGDPAIELLVLEKVTELRATAFSRKG